MAASVNADIAQAVKRFSRQKLSQQIDEYNKFLKTYLEHLNKYGSAGHTTGEVNRIERQLQQYRRLLQERGRRFGPGGDLLD